MEKLISIRRAVIVIILLLLTNAGLHAANTMQMGSASMGPLQPFTLQVSINNSSQFVAFQFDLPIPAGFSYVGNSAALNPSRSNGHILQAELISGNTLRVFGFSFNNTFFLGDTGTIVTFQLQSGTMPGEFPLNLVGPIIGDINQVNILTGSFNGIATVLAPDINITATLIDFDRTPLGQSTTRSFQIDNLGNQPLNILSITFDSPYFEVVGNSTFSIGAGQSANVIIRFNSVVKGFYNNMMTIASNDPDEIATTVNLQSHAYAVNELHAETLSVFSGQQGTLHLSINNMEPFTGFQFDLQLPAPMSYIIGSAALTNRKTDHVVSANMIAGNKLRVIAYSPTMKLFTGTEGDIVTVTFMIVGPGGYYPLDLSDVVIGNIEGENCLSDFYNGYLQIAAPDIECNGSLPFGDVSVLDTGHQNLQVNNQGNDTLKIHQVTFTNPVFSLATPLPLNILPYEAKNLRVDFHQPSEGQATGTMKIFSNDPEPYENPKPVSLSGYAFNPNYMIVPDLVCKNVDTIRIPVKVDNIEEFVGFQFDLNFPSILHYVPNSAVLSTRAQGHLLMEQILGPSAVRLISFSLSQLPFTGDTGTIATLTFTINTQDPSNTLLPLTLTNAILGNALSQNILYAVQNGNLSIVFSHAISGSLVYNNIYNTPLDSVWVFLSQNNIRKDSVLTQANGNYSFSNVSNGTYTLSAGNARPWAGVNGTDALKIMRFIIGWEPFSTFIRETAADVDNSSSVSAVDVLKVKKRFVGLDTTFARGDWTFEKQTGGNIVIMNDGDMTVDLYGLCVGDVNGSHIPGTAPKSLSGVEISASKTIGAKNGSELFIPITLDGEFDLGALSLALEFPQELVDILEVNCIQGDPIYAVKENRLNIVWAETDPIHVYRNEPVLFIRIRTNITFSEGQTIRFGNVSELTEVSDSHADPIRGITVHIPSVCYSGTQPEQELLIFPNPAYQYVSLIFRAPETGNARISIYDNAGRQVYKDDVVPVSEGLTRMGLNVSGFSHGTYFAKLEFNGINNSFKTTKALIVEK